MKEYDISEQAYKNGMKAGYESGYKDAARQILSAIEAQFAYLATCECGRRKMPDFYNYCPYCGRSYGKKKNSN